MQIVSDIHMYAAPPLPTNNPYNTEFAQGRTCMHAIMYLSCCYVLAGSQLTGVSSGHHSAVHSDRVSTPGSQPSVASFGFGRPESRASEGTSGSRQRSLGTMYPLGSHSSSASHRNIFG